jgi:hypothetical protein
MVWLGTVGLSGSVKKMRFNRWEEEVFESFQACNIYVSPLLEPRASTRARAPRPLIY